MSIDYHWSFVEGALVEVPQTVKRERGCRHDEVDAKFCPQCGRQMWFEYKRDDLSKFEHEEDGWHHNYHGWKAITDFSGGQEGQILVGNILLKVSDDDYGVEKLDIDLSAIKHDTDELIKQLEADGFKVLDSGFFKVCWTT